MADAELLKLPFFEARHRELADRIAAWAERSAHGHGTDEYAASRALVRALGAAGFLGYCVPASGGGLHERLDVRSLCLIRETLAWHDGLADFAFVMQGLGSGPISLFGTPELHERFLGPVARGERVAAFALSEEAAGSDVSALATSARRDGAGWVLNGQKCWISNAGLADFYTVVARTGEAPGAKGLSAFIVEADTPGLATAPIQVISPHPLGTVTFEECRVPGANLLGAPGEGFKIAMATLDVFRSTVGAAALGFARRALHEAAHHAQNRRLFGQALAQFQITRGKVADMAVEIDAAALLIYRAAWLKDSGADRVTREAAMAKLFATESAQRIIDQAVQILGGQGVVAGSVLERLYRDIRPLRIYEGTSEIQKLIIAAQVLGPEEKKA